MNGPDHVIQVICDNPDHARGKQVKVVRFGRFVSEHGEPRWLIWVEKHWRITPPDSPQVHRRYDARPELGSTYRWACKLCDRSLETREDTLQQLLETTYRGTDPQEHLSLVSLHALLVLASKRPH